MLSLMSFSVISEICPRIGYKELSLASREFDILSVMAEGGTALPKDSVSAALIRPVVSLSEDVFHLARFDHFDFVFLIFHDAAS